MKRHYLTILLISILGIVLRLLFYSYNRCFWMDEAGLVLNILDVDNYFLPLKNLQAAPAFFMYLSKIMYNIFPQKELALRFLPLVFSICSILVFGKFINFLLNKSLAKITAVAIFCVSYPLVYYAQEFKPYSLDVLCFLLILLSYDFLKTADNIKKRLILSFLYSVALFLSFPSIFGIFVVFFNLLLFNHKQFKKYLLVLIPILITFGYYLICYKSQIINGDFHPGWQDGFFSFNIKHNINLVTNFFNYIFNLKFPAVLFFVSIILCVKNRKKINTEKLSLLLLSIALACILAILNLYPLAGRVSLYITPIIIIFTSKFLDFIKIKNTTIEKIICIVFCVVLVLPPLIHSNNLIIKKEAWLENIVWPLEYVKNEAKSKDIIIISYGGHWPFEYYRRNIEIKNTAKIEQNFVYDNDYINRLNSYPKGFTYYWIYTHNKNKLQRLTAVYNWAKTKKDFKFVCDKNLNTVIRFKL